MGLILVASGGAMIPCAVAEDASISVVITTVNEEALRGSLLELTPDGGAVIETADSRKQHIPLDDLVRLRTELPKATPDRFVQRLMLRNGDVIKGEIADSSEDLVAIETVDLGRIEVPLDDVTQLVFGSSRDPAHRQALEWFDRDDDSDEDRVLLINGDVARGFVVSASANGVVIDGAAGEARLPQRRIVKVRFASGRASPEPPTHALLTLRNSGRLTVTDLNWKGNVVEALVRGEDSIRVEAERIVRIDFTGGRWLWLSTSRPISFQHTPMLSLPWSYSTDRNVLGGPITVSGQEYEHGIGVHSRSVLTYDLRGEFETFVTSFGIDDDSGPRADVTVMVLVDGQPRFERQHVIRGTLHGPVRLDVKRANHIELLVDFGAGGDLQDRFNWVEPALIR